MADRRKIDASPSPSAGLTFADVAEKYLERHVNNPTRRKHPRKAMKGHITRLCALDVPAPGGGTVKLGTKPIATVSKADVEEIRAHLRAEYEQTAS